MLGAAIIVFREVLEAALIVGIVLAASAGAPRRGFWVSIGLAGRRRRRRHCGSVRRRDRRGGSRHRPGIIERGDPSPRRRHARLAQHLDVAPRARARRNRARGRRCGDLGRPAALCPRGGGRARRVARRIRDGAVPLRHRCGRRSRRRLSDRRRRSWGWSAAARWGRRSISGCCASRPTGCSRSPAGWCCCSPPGWPRRPPDISCRPTCCRRSATPSGTPRPC